MWGLGPQPGIEPTPSALGPWRPSHKTTGEICLLVPSISRSQQETADRGATGCPAPAPSIAELKGEFGTESLIASRSCILEAEIPPLCCWFSSRPFSVGSSKKWQALGPRCSEAFYKVCNWIVHDPYTTVIAYFLFLSYSIFTPLYSTEWPKGTQVLGIPPPACFVGHAGAKWFLAILFWMMIKCTQGLRSGSVS